MKLSIIISFILFFQISYAQSYFKSSSSTISPTEIIISNYTNIKLDGSNLKESIVNIFDYKNVYTTLQLINDNVGNIYHIIYQTNFDGKIIFLAFSNNLQKIITNPNKPSFQFQKCIKQINEGFSSTQVSQDAITCVLNRLNS